MIFAVLAIVFILATSEAIRRHAEGEDVAMPIAVAFLTLIAGAGTELEVIHHADELAQTRREVKVAQAESGQLRVDLDQLGQQARNQERQHEIALDRLQADAQAQLAAARDEVAQVRAQLGAARQTLLDVASSQQQLTAEARNALQAADMRVGALERQLGDAEVRLTALGGQNAQLATDIRSATIAVSQMERAVTQLQPRHMDEATKSALLAFVKGHPGHYSIHSVPGLGDAVGLVEEISDVVIAGGGMRPDWDSQYNPNGKSDHVMVAAPDQYSAQALANAIHPVDPNTTYYGGSNAEGYAFYLGARG